MIWIGLHGWGSSAERFRMLWEEGGVPCAPDTIFLDGLEEEPLTGTRRWFPLTGREERLATSLEHALPAVEAALQDALARRGARGEEIGLFGHAQGGMLTLALALRQRVRIVRAVTYAAFLPELYLDRVRVAAPLATTIAMHSSREDRFVRHAAVNATVARLRELGVEQVEHMVALHLPHEFNAHWLEAASYRSRCDVRYAC